MGHPVLGPRRNSFFWRPRGDTWARHCACSVARETPSIRSGRSSSILEQHCPRNRRIFFASPSCCQNRNRIRSPIINIVRPPSCYMGAKWPLHSTRPKTPIIIIIILRATFYQSCPWDSKDDGVLYKKGAIGVFSPTLITMHTSKNITNYHQRGSVLQWAQWCHPPATPLIPVVRVLPRKSPN